MKTIPNPAPKGSILRLAGLLARPGRKAPTSEEMKETIARFHAEENQRILRQGRDDAGD
jgi:hypothetical protein